jgi:transposase-like protein
MPLKISTTITRSGPSFTEMEMVPVKCPKCGHEANHSFARLKDDPILTCSSCAEQFKIESGGSLGEVANQLDDIDRLFDKIGKG